MCFIVPSPEQALYCVGNKRGGNEDQPLRRAGHSLAQCFRSSMEGPDLNLALGRCFAIHIQAYRGAMNQTENLTAL